MALSEADLVAQGLTVAQPGGAASPAEPPLGAPDAVVYCNSCGNFVRTHAPDRCRCGLVAVTFAGGAPVLRDPDGVTTGIIFRLVHAPAV